MHIALFVRAATEGWTIKSNVLGEIKIFVCNLCMEKEGQKDWIKKNLKFNHG